MKEQAIKKLQQEMESNKNNRFIEVIGTYLLGYLEQHEDFAAHILKEKRTIRGSLDEMRKEARKYQVSGVAVLPDEEGFDIVIRYFESGDFVKKQKQVDKESPKQEDKQDKEKEEVFKRDSYYYHPESDSYVMFRKGDPIPEDTIEFEPGNKITKKEYEKGIAKQAAHEDDNLDDLL